MSTLVADAELCLRDQADALAGSGQRGTQLRGCPPPFRLLLDAAALSAPPT